MPKEQFYIKVLPGGRPLKFREKGGGVYTQYQHAQKQLDRLRRSGVRCELYRTVNDWRLVDSQPAQKETLF